MLFLINPRFPISFCCQKLVEQQAAPRTEVITWDRLESPSVNILFMIKLLSPEPLSWDMDCLLTLWPLLIPCYLGNGYYTFGFLIFIIVERNFLYNSLYILTERSLKHLCCIRAWVPVSVCLSFFPSLSLHLALFHFLIVDSGPPGSGPLKDPNIMANRWWNSGNNGWLYFSGPPKSLQMVIATMKLKDAYSLEGNLWPT